MMEAYPWPGNVRQLENSVERAVYLAEGELVTAAELPPEVRAFQGSAPSPAVPAAEGESPSGGEGEDEAARIRTCSTAPTGTSWRRPACWAQPKNFISKAPTVSHRLQLASDLYTV